MSQTQMYTLVRDFDELQDRVREAVREGGFSLADFGIGGYEHHGFRGIHHAWGLEYDGPREMEFVVLTPEEGDDGPMYWTEYHGDHEAEMKATINTQQEVLDGSALVVVRIEQR